MEFPILEMIKKKLMTAQQILENKGYNNLEIIDLLQAGENNLDMKVRLKYSLEYEPLHLWESYYIGDASESTLLEIAQNNNYESVYELLSQMDKYLIQLANEVEVKEATLDQITIDEYDRDGSDNISYYVYSDFNFDEDKAWEALENYGVDSDGVTYEGTDKSVKLLKEAKELHLFHETETSYLKRKMNANSFLICSDDEIKTLSDFEEDDNLNYMKEIDGVIYYKVKNSNDEPITVYFKHEILTII